jgi:excisionase family DNA binding protein
LRRFRVGGNRGRIVKNDLSTTATPVKLALSVPEAAEALSVSERSVWAMIETQGLPHVRLGAGGGRVLIPVRELTDWLTARAAKAAAAGTEPKAQAADGDGKGVTP